MQARNTWEERVGRSALFHFGSASGKMWGTMGHLGAPGTNLVAFGAYYERIQLRKSRGGRGWIRAQ